MHNRLGLAKRNKRGISIIFDACLLLRNGLTEQNNDGLLYICAPSCFLLFSSETLKKGTPVQGGVLTVMAAAPQTGSILSLVISVLVEVP